MKYMIKVEEKTDGNYLLTYINSNNYTCTIDRSELLRMMRAQEMGTTDTIITNVSLSKSGGLKVNGKGDNKNHRASKHTFIK